MHPDGDGLAVEVTAEAGGRLDTVTDGVAVVEQRSRSGFTLVLGDDAGLDGGAAGDQFLRGEGRGVAGARFEELHELFVEDEAVLHELGEAAVEVAGREGGEEGGVGEDEAGLGEGADEVLANGVVDAGLATDGGIDHAEERGGDVDEGDTAQDGGGGKATEVGDDAAAEADKEVAALDPLAEEPVVHGLDGGEGLVLLAGGDGHLGRLEAGRAERVEGRGGKEGAGAGIGEDEGPAGEADAGTEITEAGKGAFADDDGVARAGRGNGGGYPGMAASAPEPSPSQSRTIRSQTCSGVRPSTSIEASARA